MNDSNNVEQAIISRRSIRAFSSKAVSNELIKRMIKVAATAPSGSNIQPWQVHVVTGAKKDELAERLSAAHQNKTPSQREYEYYPTQWRSPYIERRRENGWGLYGTLGIKKGEYDAMFKQHGRNYVFFDAPTILVFTIDKDLEPGSWLDYGMFLQNIMIAARAHDLHTCPQAAIANYAQVVKEVLGIGEDKTVLCNIAIGYEDTAAKVNEFRATRVEIDAFTKFYS